MPKRNAGPRLRWRKDRDQWEIQWFDHGRRRARSCGTADPQDAADQLARFITEREAQASDSGPRNRLITDILLAFLEEHVPLTKDPERARVAMVPLAEFFMEVWASDITDHLCRRYAAQRFHRDRKTGLPTPKRISNGTIRRELATLQSALNHDFKQRRLIGPVADVWMPSAPPPKDRWLTRSEVAALLREARPRAIVKAKKGTPPVTHGNRQLALFILMGIYTAARRAAILRLTWDQIDLDRRLIHFAKPGEQQSNKGKGAVKIPRRLVTFLRYAKRRSNSDYLFPAQDMDADCPHLQDVKKGFSAACDRAGIEGATPHTLRHTAATWMAMEGVPMPIIAHYLGHRSTRMVEDVYAKYAPDYLAQGADALDRPRAMMALKQG